MTADVFHLGVVRDSIGGEMGLETAAAWHRLDQRHPGLAQEGRGAQIGVHSSARREVDPGAVHVHVAQAGRQAGMGLLTLEVEEGEHDLLHPRGTALVARAHQRIARAGMEVQPVAAVRVVVDTHRERCLSKREWTGSGHLLVDRGKAAGSRAEWDGGWKCCASEAGK